MTLNKKNKARETKEGTKEYYSIRLALANHLHDYILYTSDGKAVNTGEKRLNTPTLVAVVNVRLVCSSIQSLAIVRLSSLLGLKSSSIQRILYFLSIYG